MGYFTISSKKKLSEMEVGEKITESDFASLTPTGEFVQMKYVEEDDNIENIEVNPGIWCIQKTPQGMQLQKAAFSKDKILDSFIHTQDITDKIDCFFRNLHIYAEHGIEVPKRAMLLYGPPGTGKTSTINKVCGKYNDGKTAIVIWNTDKFEAYQVKDFFKTFKYNVDKIILVVEDIGGVEIDQTRMRSDSSLLSLLDNKEKTFKVPVLILATTNFPEVFMGNLTNRPERFDDKIEVGYPDANFRAELLKFYSKTEVSENLLNSIKSNKASKLSAAHIREIVIRSRIYEKTMEVVLNEIIKEIEHYEKAFSKQKALGLGLGD